MCLLATSDFSHDAVKKDIITALKMERVVSVSQRAVDLHLETADYLIREETNMLGIPFLEKAINVWIRPHSLDDPVDRLNYSVTTTILVFFVIMVSAKQYVGSPIQCWTPDTFRFGWEQYSEDICFIQNTFYIPFNEIIPKDTDGRQKAELVYYQWVPMVLALQAILFYLPNWIWKTLNIQTGVNVEGIVADARKMRAMTKEKREEEAEMLAEELGEALDMTGERSKYFRFMCMRFGKRLGSYVSMLYIFTKASYLCNLVIQMVLLDKFLGAGDIFWGFTMMDDLINGREWQESGMFPRVTLCDFQIRVMANVHRYTIPCVLMINMFNEKIYLFLWLWFTVVLFVTLINFVYCVSQLIFSSARIGSVKHWLSALSRHHSYGPRNDRMIVLFTNSGLQPDGILVMRFIEAHAGTIVAMDLTIALYNKFLKFHENTIPKLNSTKSTSLDKEPQEVLYNPEKFAFDDPEKVVTMEPDHPCKQ